MSILETYFSYRLTQYILRMQVLGVHASELVRAYKIHVDNVDIYAT